MSNTSTVTPYEAVDNNRSSATETMSELFSWLGDTGQDRVADERAAAMRDQQLTNEFSRSRALATPPMVSIKLHMKKADTLLKSVSAAGYQIVQELPRKNADFLILQNQIGERVALEQVHGGGVRLHAAYSRTGIDAMVRRHSDDCAVQHLVRVGLQTTRKVLPNGEIQLQGRRETQQGKEELRVQIRKDGSSVLDVVDLRGPRCEEIADGFAEAVGGKITATKWKEEYYCLPGKLRRERVRAK